MGIDARMYVLVKGRVFTPDEISVIHQHAAERFEEHGFFNPMSEVDAEEMAYLKNHEIGFNQDGQWLEVNLSGRYYGPHYERGPILFYCGLAEFLEFVTGGRVYYGGDCDVFVSLFDLVARDEIKKHFYEYGYTRYRDTKLPQLPGRVKQ